MMLPILISVSLAPVSYFFWASALWDTQTMATAASAAVRRPVKSMVSPVLLLLFSSGLSPEPAGQLLANDGDLSRPVRDQEDDKEEQDAEHGAGEALGDAFRDVRDEDDERRSDKGAGQPADAADDHAEEQGDRKRDGVAVGRNELHRDGPEPAGDAGDPGADAERERLVQRNIDAHRGGRDLVVADRHERAPRSRAQQIDRADIDRNRDREREIIEPHVLGHRQAERRIRLGHDQALHAAGPVLEETELQELWHRGREREGREREIDAGQAQRRLAEQEAHGEADDARDRQRQRIIDVGVLHQDRGSIGTDRVEGALAERELAAAAGQDVQRQHGYAVDQQHRHLEDDEVLDEQRHHEQQGEHHQRSAGAQRHGAFRNSLYRLAFGDDFLGSAHDQTRFTMGRPNRPAGLTTRTVMMRASAIGSFSSLPTPGI